MSIKQTKKTLESQQKPSILYNIQEPSLQEKIWQDRSGIWWVTPPQKKGVIIEDHVMFPQPNTDLSNKELHQTIPKKDMLSSEENA